jgi:hypothetical protein
MPLLLAHASHHLLITFCVLEFAVNQAAAGYGNTGLLTVMFLYCVAEGEGTQIRHTHTGTLQAVIFTAVCAADQIVRTRRRLEHSPAFRSFVFSGPP